MKNNLIGMELLIKDDTIVTVLGKHTAPTPDLIIPTEFTTVQFAETGKSQEIISVEGHIKIKFYKPEAKFNTEVGGVGCITDGQYKVTINISNYQGLNFEKGVCVKVIGTVDTSGAGPVSIKCINDLCVTEVEGAPKMSAADVSRGNKTPKRGRD
ncbi:uncharacterized protein LOC131674412 [Phymastichus coffea]|uniref:uncharacterized protein LOC131674412 n=1 Tax=Phymastichus coffea TaxID=108790 RepID=UPI00273BEFC4|nr:uncharacterized protein LOC131674412 [Phymastichus coffea]